jgi:peroxiredoxin
MLRKMLLFVWLLSLPATAHLGQTVPDFTLLDLEGRPLTLSSLGAGQPLVLVFWCSSCHSCRQAEEALDQMRREFLGRARVVAVDASAGESPESIRAALGRKNLGFEVLQDPHARLCAWLGADLTTTTALLDARGRLVYLGRFGPQGSDARRALGQVLAGQPVQPSHTELEGCPIERAP